MISTNEEVYDLFLDEANEIFGFASIRKKFNLSAKDINQIKENFYSEYDKETHEIYKIIRRKQHRFI